MEKKTSLRNILLTLLCAAALGAALGLARARHAKPACTSSLNDQALASLERNADAAGSRIGETIEQARSTARDLVERERETLEGYRGLAGSARDLAGGLDRIGENAEGARAYLDELAGLLAELQRRSEEEHP